MILFLLVIPILWNRIDKEASQAVRSGAERQRSSRKLERKTFDSTTTSHTSTTTTTTNDAAINGRNSISTGGARGRGGYLSSKKDKYGKHEIPDDAGGEGSPCPSLEFEETHKCTCIDPTI